VNTTCEQLAAWTTLETCTNGSPVEFSTVNVTLSCDGPGLATTSSTSALVILGRDGTKLWRASLSKFVHAFAHAAVFAWSGTGGREA